MMTTLPIIKDHLAVTVLTLTPIQRWDAAGKQFSLNFVTERWFIITMLGAMLILISLLLIVSFRRTLLRQRASSQLFDEYADRTGLSARERQILLTIASYAGLKECEAIFTMASAFDLGAARMIEESLTRQGPEAGGQLKIELSFLREKLGFTKKSNKLSSRQIPEDRKVHITRRIGRHSDEIEATVVENNDIELTLKLATPVRITFGEVWRVRYYFGASVWEFETSVLSYDGDVLVLHHSDDVRFINRRRFLRVPVNKPAFIASFPFAKALVGDTGVSKEQPDAEQDSADGSDRAWGPPQFIPAVVTELAGPGLRMEAPLEVNVGDRVLVVVRLGEGEGEDSNLQQTAKTSTSRVIQDIGEVRHTKAIQNGFSVAVELVGLSDTGIDELVRATNAASLSAAAQDTPLNLQERTPEPSVVQGV